jgi:hypothetical protein
MNIDDLKNKVKMLERAKDAVEYVLHYISDAESYCSQVDVEGSHHGQMEYEDGGTMIALRKAQKELKRLRYIVDSIPDEVWEDMKTWESMKGVIE